MRETYTVEIVIRHRGEEVWRGLTPFASSLTPDHLPLLASVVESPIAKLLNMMRRYYSPKDIS